MNFSQFSGNGTAKILNNTRLHLTFYQEHELLAWSVLTGSISVVGVVACILVTLATWPKRNGGAGVSFLIFHWMAVDFFVCLLIYPLNVIMVQATHSGVTLPAGVCRYFHSALLLGGTSINWCDAGIGLNRFIALFFPHRYRAWASWKADLLLVTFGWLMSGGTVLLVNLGGLNVNLSELGQCVYVSKGGFVGHLVAYLLYTPQVVTGVAALLILAKAYFRRRTVGDRASEVSQRMAQRKLKMAKVLLGMFFWSAVCSLAWLPVSYSPEVFKHDSVAVLWSRTCLIAQFAFCPCIMLVFNADYRKRILERLTKLPCLSSAAESHGGHSVQDSSLRKVNSRVWS